MYFIILKNLIYWTVLCNLRRNTHKDTEYYIYLLILNKHWCDATSFSSELVTGSHSVLIESDEAWRVNVGIFAIATTLLAIQCSSIFSQNEILYTNFTTPTKNHYTFRSLRVLSLSHFDVLQTITKHIPQTVTDYIHRHTS
jgi:hypothetical protein